MHFSSLFMGFCIVVFVYVDQRLVLVRCACFALKSVECIRLFCFAFFPVTDK